MILSRKLKITIGAVVLIAITLILVFKSRPLSGEFSGSMLELFERGGNQKCVWEQTSGDITTRGDVFVSDKKFSSSITRTSGGKILGIRSLSDGEFFYSWTNLAPLGIRMDIGGLGSEISKDTPQAGEFSLEYSFECEPWTPDETVFAIPTDIVFSNIPSGN